jgi:hypothetical protein
MTTTWFAASVGSGPYWISANAFVELLATGRTEVRGTTVTGRLAAFRNAFARVEAGRAGFQRSGGGTNIAPFGPSPPEDGPPDYLKRFLVGVSTLFVPMTLLQLLGIVHLSGGRGLIFLTDLDTIYVDALIVATFAFLWYRWDAARARLPFVAFLLVLGITTGGLMAYVVTNFGTLFRLRMMVSLPIWLLAVAALPSTLERLSPGERLTR